MKNILKIHLFVAFAVLITQHTFSQNNSAVKDYKIGEKVNEYLEVYDTANTIVKIKIPEKGFLLIYRYRWANDGRPADTKDSIKALEAKISEILLGGMVGDLKVVCLSYDKGINYTKWIENIKKEKPFKSTSKYTVEYYNVNGIKETEDIAKKLFSKLSMFGPDGRLLRWASSIEKFDYYIKDYNITLKAKLLTVIGGKKEPLNDAIVHISGAKNDTLAKAKTDKYGDFELVIPNNQKDYTLNAEAKDKNTKEMLLVTQEGKELAKMDNSGAGFKYKLLKADVLELSDMKRDDDITLSYKKFKDTKENELNFIEQIVYALNEFTIDKQSEETLNKVFKILSENPKTELQIISHTDSQGDDKTNMALSEKRAKAVADYLVKKGIAEKRIKSIGKGESEIRNRCFNNVNCSDKEHEYNRRTEFKFIK